MNFRTLLFSLAALAIQTPAQTLAPPDQKAALYVPGPGIAASTDSISLGASFTIETWFTLDTAAPSAVILGKDYRIGLDPSGTKPTFSGGGAQVVAPAAVPQYLWTHVAAVLDAGVMRLYVNGQAVGSQNTAAPPATSAPFALGGGFSGSLRQARVWSRALTPAEVQTYAATAVTGSEPGLLSAWPLDEGAGTTARDLGPSHATLALAPAVKWVIFAPATPQPEITGVSNAAGGQPGVVPGAFVSVYGRNFTPIRVDTWSRLIVDGRLPTELDQVSVTIGGKPAYIYAISPTQINLLPPDLPPGPAPVVVRTQYGITAAFTTTVQTYSPAFFVWPGSHVVATRLDYTQATTAKPGEVVVLWATGLGPTTPAVPAGQVPGANAGAPTNLPVTVTLNEVPVVVYGAAISGFPGVYQIAIRVPAGIEDGEYAIAASINGIATPKLTLTVQR